MANRRIKVRGSTLPKVDHAVVAEGLGAEHSPLLRQLSKEEAQEYEPVGGPYRMEVANESMIRRNAGSMLAVLGKSIDELVGYRVLDIDEEPEFRKQCGQYATVVRYYARKR
ncbi:MAG: hypothetical protein AABX31_03450 [Nanoarchaeota archaeon]